MGRRSLRRCAHEDAPAADFALLVEVVSDGEAVVYQYRLARLADGPATYVETRVTTLTTLES
ncbi:hypothetical protein [Jiangella sp. DSM 45060]|uniref:hypothetical protein n=1 Tax=Jiangella sp. DSM 45060 TaxID=1798224 RepID=UPI0012FE3712|nr:hypothetical protein [Jiangella sp. DSM 45060]